MKIVPHISKKTVLHLIPAGVTGTKLVSSLPPPYFLPPPIKGDNAPKFFGQKIPKS